LKDFVLKGRHTERSLLRRIAPYWNVDPANGWRFVEARLEAVQEALEILFQVLLIARRRLTVYARRAIFARPAIGFPQEIHVDVVSQAHHDPRAVFPCQLCYPLKSR
jgi:hypothetical protein